MRKWLSVLVSLILAVAVVLIIPKVLPQTTSYGSDYTNEQTLLKQKILSYEKEPQRYYKLYNAGRLVAIIHDYDRIREAINEEYERNYAEDFPDLALDLGEDLYISRENVYYRTEDIDEAIIDYLLEDDHLGVKAYAVEFSTKDGIYDVIYVRDLDDFQEARDRFLLNFVSAESLAAFRSNSDPGELTDYGTMDIGLKIQETITSREAVASADQILTDVDSIYTYLCYGRNEERKYYTVQQGDTLSGVGSYFRDMSASQIMMLNPGVITSVDQVLEEGLELNVAYYTSPLTVVVTKERLAQEMIYPDLPQYIEDPNLFVGEEEIITPETNGLRNVLHEETWINGVQQEGDVIRSSVVTLEPIQAVIRVGTKPQPNTGTGNFIWPIDNVSITCGYGCYYGHTGTDLQNMYNRYDNVYAADNGTVVNVSFDSIGGNWIVIDHNNGYQTYYGHLNVPAYPSVGDTVTRGQIIGQIGMTGLATGPHCHFEIRVNGTRIDACSIMPCDTVPWR